MALVDEDATIIQCANPDCRVHETGRCVEGLELGSCSYYGQEPESEDGEFEDSESEELDSSVSLPSSETMTSAEATRILCQIESRVIAVIGPSDSGKTSLIASLFDLLQSGPILGAEFSRSRTLMAFEHTCHDARSASRRSAPHMNRTPIGTASFYHIEVGIDGKHLALLLGDRAGEEYRVAADDISVVAGFSEVSRADTLTLLIDGERLLDSGARHNLRSDVMMMLQSFQEGGGLHARSRLALVLTKLDAIQSSPHQERALRDFDSLVGSIQQLYSTALLEIAAFQIAASPKSYAIERGTGLPQLLSFWLKPPTFANEVDVDRSICRRAFTSLQPLEELND